MLLYHGSNVVVKTPRIFQSDRQVDFGSGFYLTSSFDQAKRWATLVTRRRAEGSPLVSVFEYALDRQTELSVCRFEEPTIEWLSFVGANRRGEHVGKFDLVVGPVANDDTMPTLRLYFAGAYTEEEAIRRLLPQKLRDQYAFKTQRALELLTFREVSEA